jgi:hypothetical protein
VGRNHPGDEDEQVRRPAGTHERRSEAAERVADDDQVRAISDGLDDRVRVIPPAGGFVLRREVDRNRVVTALFELTRDEMPVPGAAATAVDERERAHRASMPPSRAPS